jgi:enamine deaminase RidA (YjgF/YER057c/UK114 family)
MGTLRLAAALVAVGVVGVADAAAQAVQRANPPGLSTPAPGTFSHVARAGKLVFIAGQVGTKADGSLAGSDMKAQLEQVLENLRIALASQGADFSHVTKLTTFVTSITEYRGPGLAEARARYFGSTPPPNTLVQIAQLANPAFKIEIEATAALP